MSAIIISMNFLYCADRETRTLTLLLAPGPKPEVSTFHHIRINALFGQYCSFPRVQSAKLFLEYHLGATQMIFTPRAPMRFYMFYVEAKGIEPLLEEPKSSVLPLDDASKK